MTLLHRNEGDKSYQMKFLNEGDNFLPDMKFLNEGDNFLPNMKFLNEGDNFLTYHKKSMTGS